MKSVLFLLAIASVVWAQPKFEVRGSVVEPGVGGIADAEVSIMAVDDPNILVRTDAQGNFRSAVPHGGMFLVTASKYGYFLSFSNNRFQPVMLTTAQPAGEFKVELVRGGKIAGRVLDEETRQPVTGAEVYLVQRRWNFGQVYLVSGALSAKTDRDGRFQFAEALMPRRVSGYNAIDFESGAGGGEVYGHRGKSSR